MQVAVSSAGVRAGDNPVAALLRHAEGRAPRALDLAWTRAVDRTLRRAGRADLAKTFAANLRRFEDMLGLGAFRRDAGQNLPLVSHKQRVEAEDRTGPGNRR